MPLAALLSAGEEAGRAVVGGSQLPPFVRGKLKPVRLLGHTTSRKWKHVLQPWLHFQDFDSFFFFSHFNLEVASLFCTHSTGF